MSTPAAPARPARGDELDLRIDSLANGGTGVARLDGYVVFVRDAIPGDRVRAVVTKRKRAYAEARTVEVARAEPRADPGGRGPPGRAVAGAAVRAPARGQGRAGRRRAAPHRPPRGLRARADRPRRRAVALPQQARVLVRDGRRRRARVRLPRAGLVGARSSRSTTACSRPSAATRPATRRSRGAARRGSPAYDRRTQEGVLRNLVVREGRRTGELQVRLVTSRARPRPGRLRGGRRRVQRHVDPRGRRRRDDRGRRVRGAPRDARRSTRS